VRTAAAFCLGWALWIGALAAMLWIWTGSDLAPALLTGVAVGSALLGLFLHRWREPAGEKRRITDSSLSMLVMAFGITLAAWGLTAGRWLILVGAEIVLIGLASLARELWVSRREAAGR
jgi:hypothetical protein